MGFNILDATERAKMRQRALVADFAKIDSMLFERWVTVNLDLRVSKDNFPAWSDGRSIFFNAHHLDTETVEDIIAANGLNYHELAHLMYTPRVGHPIQNYVGYGPKRLIFNMLEDSRIERLLTAKYAATKPYFLHTVIKYILTTQENGTPQATAMLHLLTHARRYVPADLRQEYRRQFRTEFSANDEKAVTKALEDYVRADPASDTDVMRRSIDTIEAFMRKFNNPPLPDKNHNGEATTTSTAPSGGQERGQKQTKDIANANDKEEQEDEDGTGGGSDQEQDGEDGPEGEDSPGGGGGDEEDADADSEGQGSDSDGDDSEGSEDGDQDESSGTDEENGGHAAGTGAGAPLTGKDLTERLKETLEGIADNPEVARDVGQTQRLLREGRDASRVTPLSKLGGKPVDPSPDHILASKRLSREFAKINEDADPGMKTYQSSGKVNMKRAMADSDPDTVFDLWDEGQVDAADFELVLLIDRSGSMAGLQGQACEAAWSILRAVESLGGRAKTTYIAFETSCTIVKSRDEKTGPKFINFHSSGGTDPLKALEEATVVFQSSDKRRGALIILTDGAWTDTDACDAYIQRMSQAGVVTALAGMYRGTGFLGLRHGCDVFARVDTPDELIPFAREVVKTVMKRHIKR